ncbi:hypothetical protein JCM10908_001197 [Rhodotorula pacifica]|uniref:uncharacterized protein n=1 Tax=Rhodotorula pacifica TaxID=1495444 RepID=UPI00316ECE02
MRPFCPSSFSASLLAISIGSTYARTTFYDANGAQIAFQPAGAWQQDSQRSGSIRTDGAPRASLSFAFAGEQLSLYGVSASDLTVSIDGKNQPSLEQPPPSPSGSSSSVRIYLASGLDQRNNHSLILSIPANSSSLRIDRIGVSYANESGLVPALLPLSVLEATPTNTQGPSQTTSSSSSTSGSKVAQERDDDGPDGGAIAGGVIGSLAGLALIVFVVAVLIRRRRAKKPTRNSATNARGPSAKRQSIASSLFGAFGRPTPPGDFNSSPLAGSHLSHPYASSTSTGQNWVSKLARASSWKRKAERLPETRRFYGVEAREVDMAAAGLPRPPPPCVPLPSVPIGATREMEERWRTVGPTLSLDEQRRVAHSTVQVYGEALSDFGDPARHERVAGGSSGSYVVIPYPQAPVKDDILPPPPQTAQSFHNPFGSETNFSTSRESHGSLSSAEGAFIQRARPISIPLERIEGSPVEPVPKRSSPSAPSGEKRNPSSAAATRPVPVRSSSARDLVSTHCAGPEGTVSASVVQAGPSGGLARKPSVIRPDGTVEGQNIDVAGAAAQTPVSAKPTRGTSRRVRHQSSAAIIEEAAIGAHSSDNAQDTGRVRSHRRQRSGKSSSSRTSGGEEDRPGFFATREHVPRYVGERDPRLPSVMSRR